MNLILLLLTSAWSASEQFWNEREVRAAFVFNLTKYIEWPENNRELIIGFVGEDDSMGETLRQVLAGKTSESRPIQVVLHPPDAFLPRCNLLYVAHSSRKETRAILEKVRKTPVLTVGDSNSFAKEGGMIGLVTVGQQVQIQVNLDATQAARFKISSRLLNLSTIVHPNSETRD